MEMKKVSDLYNGNLDALLSELIKVENEEKKADIIRRIKNLGVFVNPDKTNKDNNIEAEFDNNPENKEKFYISVVNDNLSEDDIKKIIDDFYKINYPPKALSSFMEGQGLPANLTGVKVIASPVYTDVQLFEVRDKFIICAPDDFEGLSEEQMNEFDRKIEEILQERERNNGDPFEELEDDERGV